MPFIYLSLMVAPIILVLDLCWVGLVANNYYRSQLGSLFTPHIIAWPAILFYVIYILAIVYFVVQPGVAAHSVWKTLFSAAFLGLTAYGTYDLVNLAITTGWPLQMSIVDMGWGIVLTSIASVGAYLLATTFFGF